MQEGGSLSRAVQGTDEVLFTMAPPGFVMKGSQGSCLQRARDAARQVPQPSGHSGRFQTRHGSVRAVSKHFRADPAGCGADPLESVERTMARRWKEVSSTCLLSWWTSSLAFYIAAALVPASCRRPCSLQKEDEVQLRKSCWVGRPVFHK